MLETGDKYYHHTSAILLFITKWEWKDTWKSWITFIWTSTTQ